MPRLVRISSDGQRQVIELHEGMNRIGRSRDNEFAIEDDTVSARHCELVLSEGSVLVRDLDSTNGTAIDGVPIRGGPVPLRDGATLEIGTVQFRFESVSVVVPDLKPSPLKHAPPTGVEDPCRRHPERPSIWQCTRCGLHFCNECVHHLRRVGGKFLNLCPECSHPCRLLESARPTRRPSRFAWLRRLLRGGARRRGGGGE